MCPRFGMKWNGKNVAKKCFSLFLNGSEQVYKRFFFCLMIWNEIQSVFSSVKWFGTEFRAFYLLRKDFERNSELFPLREIYGILTDEIKISVFRRNKFFSKNGNL